MIIFAFTFTYKNRSYIFPVLERCLGQENKEKVFGYLKSEGKNMDKEEDRGEDRGE